MGHRRSEVRGKRRETEKREGRGEGRQVLRSDTKPKPSVLPLHLFSPQSPETVPAFLGKSGRARP